MKINFEKNNNFFIKSYTTKIHLDKLSHNNTNELRVFIDNEHQSFMQAIYSKRIISSKKEQATVMVIGLDTHVKENNTSSHSISKNSQLLNQMLNSIGMSEFGNMFYSGTSICQVQRNRYNNNNKKIMNSQYSLNQAIQIIEPTVIILAGTAAVEWVLQFRGSISKIRGYWYRWNNYWLMPIFHPSYLLRHPSKKRNSPKWLTWHDLKNVQSRLNAIMTDKSLLT